MARKAQFESRLVEEKDLLQEYFYPETFPILGESEEPYFEREVKFKNGDVYKLRVYITKGYPDVLPDLVVSQSPEPMPSLWTGSHETHTLPRRQDNFLRICHFHYVCWTQEYTICHVFIKGEKWLKVYVLKHLVRRKPMNVYLKEMKPTEEQWIRYAERRRVQAGPRAILNNLTPSPDELFVHPFVREFNIFTDERIKRFEEWHRQFIVNSMYPPRAQIASIAHNTE